MKRILVIDDDSSIRKIIAFTLSDEGYDVEGVANGEEALFAIDRQPPDIILLDMKMPGMDGWEFARIYREKYTQQAPIVVVTAARDASIRAAEIKAQSYLAKPFNLDELVDKVAEIEKALAN